MCYEVVNSATKLIWVIKPGQRRAHFGNINLKYMIQGDDMVFPDPMRVIEQSYKECERGMNLRTYMAIKICAATWADPDRHNTSEERAALAVKQADDLIAELNKK